MAEKKFNLKESLRKLNEIADWFENQEEIDVEIGLGKVKEGAKLVKDCKARLSEIENEFEKVRKEVEKDEDVTKLKDAPF
ncbi:MAG: exodeoxyribonuclease VII small subunit [Patescibacteria group bacterium]